MKQLLVRGQATAVRNGLFKTRISIKIFRNRNLPDSPMPVPRECVTLMFSLTSYIVSA